MPQEGAARADDRVMVCKADGIRVRKITPARVFSGPGKADSYYIHVSARNDVGGQMCNVRELDASEIEPLIAATD